MTTKIHKSWTSFLRDRANKEELFHLLSSQCYSMDLPSGIEFNITDKSKVLTNRTSSEEDLEPCNHEEEDTRMMVHVADASTRGHHKLMVLTVHTDVVVLAVVCVSKLTALQELWVHIGTGKTHQFVPCHAIAASLGPERADVLPVFHALTGCDTVSAFSGRGKKTGFEAWAAYPDATKGFKLLMTGLMEQINNDDGLPQNVCDSCVDSAMWCLLFRNLCEESEKQWTNFVHITNNLSESITAHEESEFKLNDYKEMNSLICIIKDGKCEKTICPNKMTSSTVSEYLNKNENIFKVEFDNDTLDVAFDSDDIPEKVKKRKKQENGYNKNYKYKCDKCHQKFTISANLRRHLLVRHDTVYSCQACTRKFANSESLRRHFEQCRKAKCATCYKVFATQDDLQAHTHLCQNLSHKCLECDGKSLTDEQLIEHLRSRHTCDICNKHFVSIYSLRVHLRAVHKCNIPVRPYNKNGPRKNERVKRNEDGSDYVCTHCNKKYTSKIRFEHHMRNHGHSSLICERCGRVFKNKQQLKDHLCQKEHKASRPKIRLPPELAKFMCDHCGRKYHDKGTLRHHIKWHHVFPKRFKCFVCTKRFNTSTSLKGHQVVHTKERKFKCGICENVFVTKAALLYHERLHTGERPYSCDQCGEKFLSSSRRMSHIRKKHWAPMDECSVCSAKFHTPYALRKHKARHSNPNSKLFCGKT